MEYVLTGFSDEYSADFSEQLQGLKRLNMKHLELRFADGVNVADLDSEKMLQIKNILESEGVSVSAIGSPLGKISITDDFEKHYMVADKIFKFAREINCNLIRIFSFYLNGKTKEESYNEVCEKLSRLIDLASKYSLTLCLENEEGLYAEAPEECFKLCKFFNGKLKSVFDMGNFVLCGYDSYKAYDLLKEYIEYFHIKDALKEGVIVPCGEGDANIEKILKDFKENSKREKTFVSLEPHLVDFVGLNDLATHTLKKRVSFTDEKQAFTYAHDNMEEILKRV